MWFDRQKVGAAARELADHLQLIENVRALQTAQKELGDALAALSGRIRDIEADMRVLKAETKLENLKEIQAVINSVQGGLNERIETLAIKVAQLDRPAKRESKTLK